ncbi:pentapeptide repeat-containing protein [Nonomuraea sp. NPDC050663]|uniref:pentapeptide repeat-containing protein n=1 Tax=Nonomuraea sp. NPDC050663 TaxID=3364370 RepID=UPI00378D2932
MDAPEEPPTRPVNQSNVRNAGVPRKQVVKVMRGLSRSAAAIPSPSSTTPQRRKRRWFARRARITAPTQAELDSLPVEKRQELHEVRRQRPWQHLTSAGVLLSLLLAGGGLYFTSKTWETGQKTLDSSIQGQITDRYTKAIEQLGSDKSVEVRTGGIYALARIARDSPVDAGAIVDVLAAFLEEHDYKPTKKARTPQKSWVPGSDAVAAIRVLGRVLKVHKSRGGDPEVWLSKTQFSHADWEDINLSDGYLAGANLSKANLDGAILNRIDLSVSDLSNATMAVAELDDADLSYADLTSADLSLSALTGADLIGAKLGLSVLDGADLSSADLTNAVLAGADLTDADLSGANLTGADLSGATLIGAKLGGANLAKANLADADLSSADLRGITGAKPAEVRQKAKTDAVTRF